ncbi:MAG: hypothetical protein A2X35_03515 [Elusimicrobia bacterium GWA2_61_42]|nr:MAG: hypothetical protein A2X35_03515 [Elusimicrobia bacterium GWA2_61_42]OGR77652.1 MAG: hypothetical protein A2X38_09755 [Elusimicrobia bacterium GWC2_61_25]
MKTLAGLACLSLALLCGCSGGRPGPASNGAAVVFQKKNFSLVKVPDPDLEAALEGLLSSSYAVAVKEHSGDTPMDIGFTYSLAPRGAVYPFSEIEVSCIIQEKYARRSGPVLCGDFFRELDLKIKRALADKQPF